MPRTRYEWWDICKGVLLLCTLLTSGAGGGYWYKGTEQDQARADEITRLQLNHKAALDALAGRISQTAERVNQVADVAADAAMAAQDAAGTADKAAHAASKAASTAGKAATKAGAPVVIQPPSMKADNRAINQAVQDANSQIKGNP